ncbi:ABA4-like family protein [Leptospira sp. WS92.C1]
MELSLIFKIVNNLALAGWILLIAFPKWKYTRLITTGVLGTLLFGGLYSILFIFSFGKTQGNFNSLEGVTLLFQNPTVLVAGWIHYLSFDLFIGTWESANSEKLGISRWFVIPCQIATFLFGPMGLLSYLFLRVILRKPILLEEPFA